MRPPLERLSRLGSRLHVAPLAGVLLLALVMWLVAPFGPAAAAPVTPSLPAGASCAELARADQTATNGSYWGVTLLPGHGAPGGWFGVPVCANSVNHAAPGGANISCDRVPFNYGATGCAPGRPTSDGYGWSFQCVELVVRFSAWAFGSSPSSWHGDAPYLWLTGHHPTSFVPYADGGAHAPVAGDVLVWGSVDRHGKPWPSGPAGGHVAVVAATGPGWITFVEENMLGRGGDIPEETTSLTERAGGWSVGPTFGLHGGRALYGWLHQIHNTGHVTGGSTLRVTAKAPAPASPPDVSDAVIVTGAGALAQLVWSDTHTPEPAARAVNGAAPARVLATSLGAPAGMTLAQDQTPASVMLPLGARYTFARGRDGALYAVYTDATAPAPLWQALGAPPGVTLSASAAVVWNGANLIVAVAGSDGAVWTRSGPPGMLDGWVRLGATAGGAGAAPSAFQGSPALAREPGTHATADAANQMALALAIGRDGALYEADTSAMGGWGAWSPVSFTGLSAHLVGSPIALTEASSRKASHGASGADPAGAVDALATDTSGRLWLLRRASMGQPWRARALTPPDANATALAATIARADGAAPTLTLFMSDPQISPAPQPETNSGQTAMTPARAGILVSQIVVNSSEQPTWTLLGYTAGEAAMPVAVGQGLRAIVVATGGQIVMDADAPARDLLARGTPVAALPGALDAGQSGGSTMAAAPAPAQGAGSVIAGALPGPFSFADSFASGSLDSRWVITGAQPANATVVSGALTLTAPQRAGEIEAVQGAPASGFSLTARVAPETPWPAGAQAGVRLALDPWNMVTLAVASGGQVTLCPVVSGKAGQCQSAQVALNAQSDQGVYLRITRAGETVSASVSADGATWAPLGSWSISWAEGAGSVARGAYAPPIASDGTHVAPIAYAATPALFTSMSFVVTGGGAARFSWMAIKPS